MISKRDLQKQSSQSKKNEQEKPAQIASKNELFSQQITVIAAGKPGIFLFLWNVKYANLTCRNYM